MGAQRIPVDPDAGIPDLVRRLGDDSKRLMTDEVRLAKLEMKENIEQAGKGTLWLGAAFGIGVVAMVAFTLLVATLIGRFAAGHMWLGSLIVGVVELAAGAWFIKKGISVWR